MSRQTPSTFSRAEGNLEIKLDAGDAVAAAAYVNSPPFRGFEQILAPRKTRRVVRGVRYNAGGQNVSQLRHLSPTDPTPCHIC
jgi:uptake hydrogenase large subunit